MEGLGLSWAPVGGRIHCQARGQYQTLMALQLLGISWQSPISSWSAPWGDPQSAMAPSCCLVDPVKRGKRGVQRAVRPCLELADLIVLPGQRGDTACLIPWSDPAAG